MKTLKIIFLLLTFLLSIISCNTLNQENVNDSKKENFEKPVITNFDITDYGLDSICYYISETGDDNNNGLSTSTPFLITD